MIPYNTFIGCVVLFLGFSGFIHIGYGLGEEDKRKRLVNVVSGIISVIAALIMVML
jgi:uncharacterized membrane protein HdeD (DUF308 family)